MPILLLKAIKTCLLDRKDKLNDDIIVILLGYTPEENKQEIQSLIDKYKQKDIVNELRLIVREILKENSNYLK